jgi:hypothetical protein
MFSSVVVTVEDVGDDGVADDVLLMELQDAHVLEVAESVDGVNQTVLTAEDVKVSLFGVSDQHHLTLTADTGEASFYVNREEVLNLVNNDEGVVQGTSSDIFE